MFENFFLAFLASRAKAVDNQAARQKSLILTKKIIRERK